MQLRKPLLLISCSFLLSAIPTKAATIGYWSAEGNSHQSSVVGLTTTATSGVAYSQQTVGPFIYDPITQTTRANTSSYNFSAAEARLSIADHTLLDQNSFTWEFFINLEGQPNSWDAFLTRKSSSLGYQIDFDNSTSAAFGNVRTRWDTHATSGEAGNNRTAAGGKIYTDSDGSLKDFTQNTQDSAWHHIAVAWDSDTKTFTIFTDYTRNTSQITTGPTFDNNWLAGVLIGKLNSGTYGLFMDEIRFSSGVLTTDQFLRVVPEPSTMALSAMALGFGFLRRRRTTP